MLPINCLELDINDINEIFSKLLYEFMIERVEVKFPRWLDGLETNNNLKLRLFENVQKTFSNAVRLRDIEDNYLKLEECDEVKRVAVEEINLGTGIVTPTIEDLILEEPEIVKQGSRYGVKLKAKAPSIHMIKIDTETEVSPIVGSEKQSEDLVKYLLSEFESDPKRIWESNIFGKSLHELVNEGLQNKLAKMPEEAQIKLQDTLQRIVNEGTGGLICIIL